MAAVEEALGAAPPKEPAGLRARRQRGLWIGVVAASYAVDTLLLVLFCLAGTIPAGVPLAYGALAAALSGGFYAAAASGWSERLRDPGMVAAQSFAGVAMTLGVVFAAPQVAFPQLANLFTVFAFSMVWLSVAASVVVWSACALGTGVLLYAVSERIGVPAGSGRELALVWLYFSAVLGRCVFLSVYATGMRLRLTDSRRKLAASMEHIQSLVSRDELTGTLSRRALMARLEQERARAARSGERFSMALLDLDHFKAVNDTYGHAAGDEVLRQFARTVHDTMRETDVFGRYGGEEFMMILIATEPHAAREALERIFVALRARDWSAIAAGLAVKVSAGVTGFRAGDTVEQLLHRADAALYQAKDAGRDRVCAA